MSEDNNCLFCRIIAGEIPGEFVHKDERCVVIKDINPQAPTHALVIPREHLQSLDDASQRDEALLGHLLRVAARVANEQGHAESGYRAVINTGAGAGQSVFHLHVHLLGGRPMHWPPG
jgi:histidine triad (HIT) family protein